MSKIFPMRFTLFKAYIGLFLILSFIVRCSFFIWNFSEVDKEAFTLIETFGIGFLFDIATISFFAIPYLAYLLFFPKRFYGSIVDKIITYFGFSIGVLIIFFSFFGEFTFWDEFQRRYNFIAVDYLIYTYEVVKNINESYPLPILISAMLILVLTSLFIVYKLGYFNKTFKSDTTFKPKLIASFPWIVIVVISLMFITNKQADFSENRYNNELAKSGIYSFFAAFRNNELPYNEFYKTIPKEEAFKTVKASLLNSKNAFGNANINSIYRTILNTDSIQKSITPNVIFICIESLSADFLSEFGNKNNISPILDSLANNSLLFLNLYATGTRTVRGMEAITLSIPPTPGRSIVKRKNNQDLFTIGEVFKQKGYERNFFYGGDGYFDNMNTYFGGNGFNIVDRGRGFLLDKNITTTRTNIEDDEVTFENAWGVCDMDIYNKVLKEADKAYVTGKLFFDFVMTTSNHKPYTYPEGKIDIPSGTGRNGAVKYTDYAIGQFIKKAQQKPWFKNTVFVIMSDHCASSAGRWELDVKNYHIPALIFNLPNQQPEKINKLASQIDVFPTLFSALHWNYKSNLFGNDIMSMQPQDERAFIGNYRKLGYLKDNKILILDEQKNANFYSWNPSDNSLTTIPSEESFEKKSISFYEVSDDLYRNEGLKLKRK
ncbi:phosphoglycerol transferase family protein, alkaline phosphatase superfamily [Galbibacter orientalis DSM 19592]|uniref:Phosphoglycerol transferase family protein, alkaline phosphatase superfamily n=2 Tax=Galbibacter TaxID=379068 RepID=I3C2F4_9FLAO|nr:alkaline phosphatase family protein [Galbibacter orientalis]EIJ37797.1 phosphoglycerol transferase family protein, alkaline phosphatase superfamily [Galbibacter orientalis DSM 19592]